MDRGTVRNLRDALRGIERDIAVRSGRLEQLKRHAQALRDAIAFYGEEAEAEELESSQLGATEARSSRGDTKVARNAIYDILRESGGPMHARDLLAALLDRSILVVGKDPVNNVRSYLSHDMRFTPVGSGQWDLASRVGSSGAGSANDRGEPKFRVVLSPHEPSRFRAGPATSITDARPDEKDQDWLLRTAGEAWNFDAEGIQPDQSSPIEAY